MKQFVVMMALSLISISAFASHPHDRVCVANASIAGQDAIEFVFQWEIGRTYESGNPSDDGHELVFEASHCTSDWQDGQCTKYKSALVHVAPGGSLEKVPVKFQDIKGDVFFAGIFDATKENLVGKINGVSARIALVCVSQPRLTLDTIVE